MAAGRNVTFYSRLPLPFWSACVQTRLMGIYSKQIDFSYVHCRLYLVIDVVHCELMCCYTRYVHWKVLAKHGIESGAIV